MPTHYLYRCNCCDYEGMRYRNVTRCECGGDLVRCVESPSPFGATIAQRRRLRGLSQTELADLANVSRGYVSLIERDRVDNLSVAILLRLAEALRMDEHELLKIYIEG